MLVNTSQCLSSYSDTRINELLAERFNERSYLKVMKKLWMPVMTTGLLPLLCYRIKQVWSNLSMAAFNSKIVQAINTKDYISIELAFKDGVIPHGVFLREAIRLGDAYLLKLLIAAGGDVNYSDESGYSLLHYAIYTKQIEIVKILVASKANLHILNPHTHLSLLEESFNNLPIAKALVDGGAFPDYLNKFSFLPIKEEELPPLHRFAFNGNLEALKEEVEKLALKGIDIVKEFDTTFNGRAPLHLAAIEGHEKIVKYLISLRVQISVLDKCGSTPLIEAIAAQHPHIAKLLIEADPQGTKIESFYSHSKQAGTALRTAMKHKMNTIVDLILKKGMIDEFDLVTSTVLYSNSLLNEETTELLLQNKLAHIWEEKGVVSYGKKTHIFAGTSYHVGIDWFQKSVRNFLKECSLLTEREKEYILFSVNALSGFSPVRMKNRYAVGYPVIIPTGYLHHAASKIFMNDYMVFVDRSGQDKPIKAYKIDPKKVSVQLFEEIYQATQGSPYYYLLKGNELPKMLSPEINNEVKDVFCTELDQLEKKLGIQQSPNCVWASLEATFYILVIGILKQFRSEMSQNEVMSLGKQIGDLWLTQTKFSSIEEYLNLHEQNETCTTLPPYTDLLKNIYNKGEFYRSSSSDKVKQVFERMRRFLEIFS